MMFGWRRKHPAWRAWENGEVSAAEELSRELSGDERLHLRLLAASARGEYEQALEIHAAISPAYRRGGLDPIAADARQHLEGFGASLTETTDVPFVDHPLTPFFPAFEIEIDGRPVVAHLDTGGPFLVMNPGRARGLGIELSAAGRANHGTLTTDRFAGRARSLRVGKAVLENVPVDCLSSLAGAQDFVILGTSFLERFLSSVDYPRKRLVLSPRGERWRDGHFQRLGGGEGVSVPFFLWGDHYLWARGGFSERRDLNFFVDSGLVILEPDGRGGEKQAAFSARTRDFVEWGVPRRETRKKLFDSSLPISLGALSARDFLLHVEDRPSWSSLGGVRIDGLLSHAFLSRRAWTLDFDRRVFVFSA